MNTVKTFAEGVMKRNHLSLVCLVLFSLLLSVGFAAEPEYRDGYLLVRFTEEGIGASADAARQAVVATACGTIEKTYTIVPGLCLVSLPEGTDVPTAQAAFTVAAGVRYAEPDYINRPQVIPNDARFNELWGMHNVGQTGGTPDADIDAPEAWDLATGSRDIIVAVIDTGVDYTHPDLVNNMWVNEAEQNGQAGVDDDNNGYVDDIHGYDFFDRDADPMDSHYHGTHCSGTIGGVGDNGTGVAGVCWTVRIMALRCMERVSGGYVSDLIDAIAYAVNMGAVVSNNSYAVYSFSQAEYDAIEAAQNAGHLFVVAAANQSNDNDGSWPAYPASYDLDNIISVMATNANDAKAGFSNWGETTVDIGAPGVGILSLFPGNDYWVEQGTSMACPHVVGAAALVLSVDPSLTYAGVKDILMTTADTVSSLDGLSVTGGRLNLYEAVLAAQAGKSNRWPLASKQFIWRRWLRQALRVLNISLVVLITPTLTVAGRMRRFITRVDIPKG